MKKLFMLCLVAPMFAGDVSEKLPLYNELPQAIFQQPSVDVTFQRDLEQDLQNSCNATGAGLVLSAVSACLVNPQVTALFLCFSGACAVSSCNTSGHLSRLKELRDAARDNR